MITIIGFSFLGSNHERTRTNILRAAVLMAALAFAAGTASAGTVWDEIKGSVYGDKKIEDGRGLIFLDAPNRPEDMRWVPISVGAAFKDGRTVKKVTFIIERIRPPSWLCFTWVAGASRFP